MQKQFNLQVPPATKQDAEAFAKQYKSQDGVLLLMDDKTLEFAVAFANKLVIPAVAQLLMQQIQAMLNQMQSAKTIEPASNIIGG